MQRAFQHVQIAHELNVPVTLVQDWEKGEATPGQAQLGPLADLLAVDIVTFYKASAPTYRTHSRVSQPTYKEQGEAQREAELAKLRAEVARAEDDNALAYQNWRSADEWSRDRERDILRATGEHLAALSAKLAAFERSDET